MRPRHLWALLLLVLATALPGQEEFGGPGGAGRTDLGETATAALLEIRRRPEERRWRVTADRIPLTIDGKAAGFLYRSSMFQADPVTGDAARLLLTSLETGLIPSALADKYRVQLPDGSSVVRGIETDSIPLRNEDLRVSGRIANARAAVFREGKTFHSQREGRPYVALTPLDATVGVAGLEPVTGFHIDLGFLERLESASVPVRIVLVDGTEARPKLHETLPLDTKAGNLGRIDYQAGLGDLMRHYKRLARGRPLHVFLSNEPDKDVAYMNSYVPLAKRKDWNYRSFGLELIDSSRTTIREPIPCVTFPRHLVSESSSGLAETLKHEVGHVVHELAGEIHNEGYDESFGAHTHAIRTNDQAAFVEGFAEYTAYKFRDTEMEGGPLPMERLMSRTEGSAQKTLLWYYWDQVRSRQAIEGHVKKEELDTLGESLHRAVFESREPPSFADFRARLVRDLTGKGEPPLVQAAVEKEIAAVEKHYSRAVENIKDEEWTAEETQALDKAFDEVVTAGTPGIGDQAAYAEANRRFDNLVQRSPTDLMLNEGFIAAALLELDKELSTGGIDFYSKVLGALKQDPYAGRSHPRVPVNFKELLAVLERDPDLQGKLFGPLEKLTGGVLQPKHFALARRRQDDPLTRARPGKPAPRASSTQSTATPTAALALDGTVDSQSTPETPASTGPRPTSEASPGFDTLRSR